MSGHRAANTDHGGRVTGGLWAPGLANLALGVFAMLPLSQARWLWTEYLPMDCRSPADIGEPGICYHPHLDHAPVVMFFLVVTGVVLLLLVLVVDVALPLRRGERLGTWLAATVLIPVPYAAWLALT